MSLNISLSHSRSFAMHEGHKSILAFNCNHGLYLAPFLEYFALNNGVTLKSVFGVVQGHWKWRRSIDHYTTSYWSVIVSIVYLVPFSSYLALNNIVKIWLRGHSRSLKLLSFEFSLGTVSYSPSTVTEALSCFISEIKRDTGRKSPLFHTPLYSTPSLWVTKSQYYHTVWYGTRGQSNLTKSASRGGAFPA